MIYVFFFMEFYSHQRSSYEIQLSWGRFIFTFFKKNLSGLREWCFSLRPACFVRLDSRWCVPSFISCLYDRYRYTYYVNVFIYQTIWYICIYIYICKLILMYIYIYTHIHILYAWYDIFIRYIDIICHIWYIYIYMIYLNDIHMIHT